MQIARHIVAIIVAIVVLAYLINQCRKPHGWPGRFFLWEMAGRHGSVTDWGLSQVAIEKHIMGTSRSIFEETHPGPRLS